MRVLFYGTPEFAVPALRALVGEGFPILAVATTGPALEGMTELLGRLREARARLLILSDVADLGEMGSLAFQADGPIRAPLVDQNGVRSSCSVCRWRTNS